MDTFVHSPRGPGGLSVVGGGAHIIVSRPNWGQIQPRSKLVDPSPHILIVAFRVASELRCRIVAASLTWVFLNKYTLLDLHNEAYACVMSFISYLSFFLDPISKFDNHVND